MNTVTASRGVQTRFSVNDLDFAPSLALSLSPLGLRWPISARLASHLSTLQHLQTPLSRHTRKINPPGFPPPTPTANDSFAPLLSLALLSLPFLPSFPLFPPLDRSNPRNVYSFLSRKTGLQSPRPSQDLNEMTAVLHPSTSTKTLTRTTSRRFIMSPPSRETISTLSISPPLPLIVTPSTTTPSAPNPPSIKVTPAAGGEEIFSLTDEELSDAYTFVKEVGFGNW